MAGRYGPDQPRRIDQEFAPPARGAIPSGGAAGSLRARLMVLTAAQAGYSGIFAYSPEPGAGTLVFSVSATGGTDPYGNAYPAGVSLSTQGSVLEGEDYILDSGGLFYYNGSPTAGNLIMSLAAVSGTDNFGNAYPQGLSVAAVPQGTGAIDGSNIAPGSIQSYSIATGAIVAGLIAAGAIDGMTLNNITVNGQTVSGCNVIVSAASGGVFAYGTGSQQVKTYTSAGSFTWTAPAGVTSVKAECWGGGGGGSGDNTSGTGGGGGGGGGEYAAEPAVAVTPGNTYTVTVGGGGAAGGAGANGAAGSNSAFTGDAATVTAHGGSGGTATTGTGGTGGAGGTGSANTTHYNGGAGANGSTSTQTTTVTASGSGTFTVPTGVSAITAKAWGAGGGAAGGGTAGGANSGGYGGGAGAYAEHDNYAAGGGQSFSYDVGAGGSAGAVNGLGGDGGPTWLKTPGGLTVVYADYGHAATTNSAAAGGLASNSTGATVHSGGKGGTASYTGGAGGGGAAGSTGNGGNGQSVTGSSGGAGGAGNDGGGTGGNGGNANSSGSPGGKPGSGGGGGGGGSSAGTGGYGRNGQLQITYALPYAGGGGGSGGTAAAGQAGTSRAGAPAVSGGGPGGGSLSGSTWTASPGSGPGGGGGGYDTDGVPGAGYAGQVRLTYSSTASLAASMSGASQTDPEAGATVPAGFMGPIVAIEPGSAPAAAETAHPLTTGFPSGVTGTVYYEMLATNRVALSVDLAIASGTAISHGETLATLPSGYYSTVTGKFVQLTFENNGAYSSVPVQVTTAGHLAWMGAAVTVSGTSGLNGDGTIMLGV